MSAVDDLLRAWAARKLNVPESEVLGVTFRHEEAYGNESGTWWPEENVAVVSLVSTAKGEPKRPRTREFSTEGYERLPDLLNEILSAGGS